MKRYLTTPNFLHTLGVLASLYAFVVGGKFHSPAFSFCFAIAFLIALDIRPGLSESLGTDIVRTIIKGWGHGLIIKKAFVVACGVTAVMYYAHKDISPAMVMVLLSFAFLISSIGSMVKIKRYG